jgi:ketosteroid isomerase-like protein
MDPTSVIERYLALISDPTAELTDIEALLDPEMLFVERPNLVSPRGSERDRGQVLASVDVGRQLLRDQRFEVVEHVADGDRVASRVVWTGTLAVEGPPFAAGWQLKADSSMHFTLRDGRILRQENFDCFHAPG